MIGFVVTVASMEKIRSWGIKSKPPAGVTGGEVYMTTILVLARVFIHHGRES